MGCIDSTGSALSQDASSVGFSSTQAAKWLLATIGVVTPVGWKVLTRMLCSASLPA